VDIVPQGWLRYLSVVFDCIVYATTLQLTVTRLGVEKLIMTDPGSSCKSGPVNVVHTALYFYHIISESVSICWLSTSQLVKALISCVCSQKSVRAHKLCHQDRQT